MSDLHERRAQRQAERRRATRSRTSRMSLLGGAGVLVAALAVVALTVGPMVRSFLAPKDYPGPGAGQVTVTVPEGATGTVIAQGLVTSGVVMTVKAFVDVAKADPRGSSIQPGVYELRRHMSARQAFDVLVDPANRLVDKVVVKEGMRLTEILQAVATTVRIPAADLQAAVKDPTSIGLPAEAKGKVEGWLFPATYEVSPGTSAADLLAQMVQRTVTELTDLGVPRERWNATIIEASLVEAERGANTADAGKIAQVFDNRVKAGWALQLDTTVNYALGRRKVAVSIADTKVNSPYNTYLVKGLPAGAICSPGAVAITAVLRPTPGPWMYFVAVNPDTGETKFATTPAEFATLQAELNAWLKANPGR